MIEQATDPSFGAMLRALVAGRCRVGWRPIDAVNVSALTPAEDAIVARAVSHRRAEFATGRQLLRSLIGTDVEILRRRSGAPVLPSGFVGSLAHDRDVAVGVVAAAGSIRAVGVDVEPVQQMDQGAAALVVRIDDVVPDPVTAFVAKEAAYKAWSAVGGPLLEHHDVNVVIDGDRYQADLRGEMLVRGELGRADGRVVAFVVIPAT